MYACPIRTFQWLFSVMETRLEHVEASPLAIAREMAKLPTADLQLIARTLRTDGMFDVATAKRIEAEVTKDPLRALLYAAAIDLAFSRLHPLGIVKPLHLSRYRATWEADGWYERDVDAGWMVVPKWEFARADRTTPHARSWAEVFTSLMIVPLDLVRWHRLGATALRARRAFDSFATYPVLEPGDVDHVPREEVGRWWYLATPPDVGQLELIQQALTASDDERDTVVLMPEAVVRASTEDRIQGTIDDMASPSHVEVLIVGCGGEAGDRQVNEARVYDPRTGDFLFAQHKLLPYNIGPETAKNLGIVPEERFLEERHTSDGELHVLETDIGRFAVIVCEDMQDNVDGTVLDRLVRAGVSHLFIPIMSNRMVTDAEMLQAIKDGDPDIRPGANWEETTTNRLAGSRGLRVLVANSLAMVTDVPLPAHVAFARLPKTKWDDGASHRGERTAFEFDVVSRDTR